MQPFMHDHIESVEKLSGGRVRVIAVLPDDAYLEIIILAEAIIHASRFLNTRARVSKAMRRLNVINEGLKSVK
jgi:hypothetical protein